MWFTDHFYTVLMLPGHKSNLQGQNLILYFTVVAPSSVPLKHCMSVYSSHTKSFAGRAVGSCDRLDLDLYFPFI